MSASPSPLLRCATLVLAVSLAGCAPLGRIDPRNVTRTDRNAAWVVLVVMSAENGLGAAAVADVNEMERAGVGTGPVVVLTLLDRTASGGNPNAVMLEIGDDPSDDGVIRSRRLPVPGLGLDPEQTAAAINMGDPHALARAIEFAHAAYEPDRLAVVIWGHGSGYRSIGARRSRIRATSYDAGSAGDALLTAELASAIRGRSVDVVGMDTSFAATIEVAWEIRDDAEFLIASQGQADVDGWPYRAILKDFAASNLSTVAFAHAAAKQFSERPDAGPLDTISVVDLPKVEAVKRALDGFSDAVHEAIADAGLRDSVRASLFYDVEGFYSTPGDLSIDLGHMARVISSEYDVADAAALDLRLAVDEAVASNHAGTTFPNATGLSVHLIPLDEEGRALPTHDPAYQRGVTVDNQPAFVAASTWTPVMPDGPGLLHRLFYELM